MAIKFRPSISSTLFDVDKCKIKVNANEQPKLVTRIIFSDDHQNYTTIWGAKRKFTIQYDEHTDPSRITLTRTFVGYNPNVETGVISPDSHDTTNKKLIYSVYCNDTVQIKAFGEPNYWVDYDEDEMGIGTDSDSDITQSVESYHSGVRVYGSLYVQRQSENIYYMEENIYIENNSSIPINLESLSGNKVSATESSLPIVVQVGMTRRLTGTKTERFIIIPDSYEVTLTDDFERAYSGSISVTNT